MHVKYITSRVFHELDYPMLWWFLADTYHGLEKHDLDMMVFLYLFRHCVYSVWLVVRVWNVYLNIGNWLLLSEYVQVDQCVLDKHFIQS